MIEHKNKSNYKTRREKVFDSSTSLDFSFRIDQQYTK